MALGISNAMGNAVSGLSANAWATDVISSNIANAQTPGYGQRTLDLSSRVTGGVKVSGVQRQQDLALLNDSRGASAQVANTGVLADFYNKLESTIGQPGDQGSLGGDISALNSALISAAAQPESDTSLASVLDAAQSLAGQLNAISATVQAARSGADAAIGKDVTTLSDALRQVADLNAEIQAQVVNGGSPSGLEDQRQALIDRISAIVPLRQLDRQNDTVALITTGGAVLLDGTKPAELGYTATNGVITPDMTLASGALSGLTLNGQLVSTTGGLIAGGRLAANFALRDTLGPQAQAQADAVARDLADRLSAADPTLAAGDPGLLTDNGAAVTAANEEGLAGRISVNALADPAQGGALWHLRAGLGATAPGNTGDGTILTALSAALSAQQAPASGGLTAAAVDATGLAAQFLGQTSSARLAAENDQTAASARSAVLTQQALSAGVDTDKQMSDLLLVEKSYAANAKVIQAASNMLDALMGI